MRILLTGGSGMVGRNLLEHTTAADFEFLKPSSRDLNLLDQHAVAVYIKKYKPDFVIHSAAKVGGIQANKLNPYGFLFDNAQIALNVINSCRKEGVDKLINISSANIYPDMTGALNESMVLGGKLNASTEAYALAKAIATKLCQYISETDARNNYISLIPCNLYGRHDKFDIANSHMIPSVIRKIHEAHEAGSPSVEIWGDGEARREFMYAEDLAACIFMVIDKMLSGSSLPNLMNVGIGIDYTINEYYQTVAKVLGYKGEFVHNLDKPVGMRQKLIDSSRIHALGWQAGTSLQQGIEKTYQYFLKEVNHG